MTREEKQQAIDILRRRVEEQRRQLADIEPRLLEYYEHMCEYVGTELGDPHDLHSGYEVLCGVKLLRLLRTYDLNRAKIEEVIYDGEGEWKRGTDGFWTHLQGGLAQPGRNGAEVYRWEPFQMFMLASMYGLQAWIGTEMQEGERRLLETERVNPDSHEIEDHRRLCTRFILFGPRKINKSGFAAITNVEDFMRGDFDAQVVCTANSLDQSKILFSKTKDLLLQLDPVSGRKFNGKFLTYTNTSVRFQKGKFRAAELVSIPAGGKMPDGKFASRSAEDEYGSAGYTNGRSDMGQTAAVIESSMGPRREPMTVITTTASLITSGPFTEMLESTHKLLLEELKYDTGEATPKLAEDRQMCLLLEPDEWEREEEYLLSSKVIRRKVNPMLGKIVQHSFYDTQVAESRMDETKKKETIAKLFNVYISGQVKPWVVQPDDIRKLQRKRKITDCLYSEGWNVFVGLDFSGGGDLFAMTFLAVNYSPGLEMKDRFFADCYLWILEHSMNESPNRQFYDKMVEKGYLRVCPGKVFNPDYAINELMSLNDAGINLVMFGYDPAQSKDPINTIKAWLQTLGIDGATIKNMVVPVNQGFMTINPLVQKLERMVLATDPWLTFSDNPMWPWMFGNVVLVYSRDNTLCRPQKSGEHKKIDGVAGLLDATYVFDLSEGK